MQTSFKIVVVVLNLVEMIKTISRFISPNYRFGFPTFFCCCAPLMHSGVAKKVDSQIGSWHRSSECRNCKVEPHN